jgi:hypothetical protein
LAIVSVCWLVLQANGLDSWLRTLLARAHRNVVVALANKLAWIAWAALAGTRRHQGPASA